jgi:putative FmdB family regulatory protein
MKREEHMPTYQYRCENGHEFTELQTIREEPTTRCKVRRRVVIKEAVEFADPPDCFDTVEYRIDGDGAPCDAPCHRVICAPNFSFKGGAPTKKFHKSR